MTPTMTTMATGIGITPQEIYTNEEQRELRERTKAFLIGITTLRGIVKAVKGHKFYDDNYRCVTFRLDTARNERCQHQMAHEANAKRIEDKIKI